MAQHEQHAGRIQPGVQRVEHGAQHRHAEMGFNHGGNVGQHDGNGVAALDAGPFQRIGQPLRAFVGLAPCAPHLAVHHGKPVAIDFRRAGDEVHGRQRGVVGVAAPQTMVEHAAHA
ncbi:hypothetical protein D3C87_1539760 [compost metagenome]